ncbi:MAG: YciI family protein [bacterium]
MMYILFYDYGENALERRAPFREQHLGLATASHADGQMVLAGAYTDPVDGAALIFQTREAAEAFVAVDPYVSSGLVTNWRIREWNVVIGG